MDQLTAALSAEIQEAKIEVGDAGGRGFKGPLAGPLNPHWWPRDCGAGSFMWPLEVSRAGTQRRSRNSGHGRKGHDPDPMSIRI